MITTDDCKTAIVAQCQKDAAVLRARFSPPLDEATWAAALEVKNWKRESKCRVDDGTLERAFDCRPFDGQLRAYVYATNEEIVRVIVQDE